MQHNNNNDSRDSYQRREREPRTTEYRYEHRREGHHPLRRRSDNPPPSTSLSRKPTLEGSRNVDMFEKVEQIGEGTYGKVYMGRNKQTNEIVALKKILMESEKEGFPITAIREIKILKQLKHKNIVQLKEIVTESKVNPQDQKTNFAIYMVFEYMEHDLAGLMQAGVSFSLPQIKCYMQQLLEGLHFCHNYRIIHRDIKGANLLIDNRGQLKLADFGLARSFYDSSSKYTNRVITLWYRPPELLLGAERYGPEIDMWGVGCILAELLDKNPIFPGRDEPDQIDKIFSIVGTPNEKDWPDLEKLPFWKNFKGNPKPCRLRERYQHFHKHALDLLEKLLTLNPKKRITASQALDSDWFWTDPHPLKPEQLPSYPSNNHEFQVKQRNKRKDQQRIPSVSGRNVRPRVGYPSQRPGEPPIHRPYPPNAQQMQNQMGPPSHSASRPPPRISSSSSRHRTQPTQGRPSDNRPIGNRPLSGVNRPPPSRPTAQRPSNGPTHRTHSRPPSDHKT